ncbi:MAG: hypothetical protein ACOYOT_05435 [Bacteroidales bacterium]
MKNFIELSNSGKKFLVNIDQIAIVRKKETYNDFDESIQIEICLKTSSYETSKNLIADQNYETIKNLIIEAQK